MANKSQADPVIKVVVIIISIVCGLALVVIIAALAIMFFVRGSIMHNYNYYNTSTGSNSIKQNNAIQNQAIEEKNPNLCDRINGEASISMPLPSGNRVQTFDEATSKQRCKAQAKSGQPYVY